MNRTELQQLARSRLAEASTLLRNGHYAGAYYLSGYVIECALKACIARQTRRHDFPDKKMVLDSYTHKLTDLVRVAGLQTDLSSEETKDSEFKGNWTIVKDWTEESRYQSHSQFEAETLYSAISDRRHGVLKWLRRYW